MVQLTILDNIFIFLLSKMGSFVSPVPNSCQDRAVDVRGGSSLFDAVL